jgi:hypothetical protein
MTSPLESNDLKPRFLSPEQLKEGLELYRLTAVGYTTYQPTRHGKIAEAVRMLCERHPELSRAGAYKDLSDATEHHYSLTK